MRVDKFMWCMRKFKTRSKATEGCRKGHVKLNQIEAKPATQISIGDIVSFRVVPIWRQYEVLELPKSRVGAKLVSDHIKEVTPWEELEKLQLTEIARKQDRTRGTGRPTKRERRDIDRLSGNE